MPITRDPARNEIRPSTTPRWLPVLLILGIYLTLRGYHSFDGDQAYRLPLLLHRQDPALYADDPFIRSIDEFNPHRGSLALLDVASRAVGLPLALFLAFVATFLATGRGIRRLADSAWPQLGPAAGWLAFILVLAAKAGNIGTNHLFEAMLLDRLVALALGWLAIAWVVADPTRGVWRSAPPIAAAAIVHPSVGLQLAMLLATAWAAWAMMARATEVGVRQAARGIAVLGVAVVPGLAINLPQQATLFGELPAPLFWKLSVEVQNPQHMLPHLWRMPQWLAWSAYPALALLAFFAARYKQRNEPARHEDEQSRTCAGRNRLMLLLLTLVIGLGVAWFAIEKLHSVRVTILQPFRMGTVARGLALALISGRMIGLWRSGESLGRMRATVLAAGFLGDWRMVVAACSELAATAAEGLVRSRGDGRLRRIVPVAAFSAVIALGIRFLSLHDTESGQTSTLIALGLGGIAAVVRPEWLGRLRDRAAVDDRIRRRRRIVALSTAWAVPVAAMLATWIPSESPASRHRLVQGLIDRCRFRPVPLDDVERLADWCRENTPQTARFIGPPGPKTFRLWSRRSLAFNRSGSPYHAAGLADWFDRFREHVDFHGTTQAFIASYVAHRHEFEARYDRIPAARLAALAIRQGADHVIAAAPGALGDANAPRDRSSALELLHTEGRYAIYRVKSSSLVQRQP